MAFKISDIIFEDNHLIAVNKQAGELVQSDKSGDEALEDQVKAYIKDKYKKPGDVFLGVVHRIDRPTSGIVLFARTSKALVRLNKMMQDREIKKLYWVVVDNQPPKLSDTLTHYLVRDEEKNKSKAYDKAVKNSKEARLTYKILTYLSKYYVLEIDLHTGRHHQIRSQLAKINCHIRGDLKYGFPRSNTDGGIHLHARSLEFLHPIGNQPLLLVASLPNESLWNEVKKLV